MQHLSRAQKKGVLSDFYGYKEHFRFCTGYIVISVYCLWQPVSDARPNQNHTFRRGIGDKFFMQHSSAAKKNAATEEVVAFFSFKSRWLLKLLLAHLILYMLYLLLRYHSFCKDIIFSVYSAATQHCASTGHPLDLVVGGVKAKRRTCCVLQQETYLYDR